MNGDLISREAAMLAIHNAQTAVGWSNGMHEMDIHKALMKVHAVDAAPVVHGRWKYFHKQNRAVCTVCSFERDLDVNFGRAVSCPNCGAKMDLEE